MDSIPLQDMLQGTPWKAPFDNSIVERDNNLITAVFRVQMWGTVISVIHRNDDTQKSTDLWQGFLQIFSQVGSLELLSFTLSRLRGNSWEGHLLYHTIVCDAPESDQKVLDIVELGFSVAHQRCSRLQFRFDDSDRARAISGDKSDKCTALRPK